MSDHLGESKSKIIVKVYIITGQDCIRQIETKHCALPSDPFRYLTNFGESDILSEQDICLAEQYLVKCSIGARSSTKSLTFDQL